MKRINLIICLVILGMLVFGLHMSASAKNITAGIGGTYSSISAAVYNASTGDRVYILPGKYVENIMTSDVISLQSCIIQAQVFGTVTIDGNAGLGGGAPFFGNAFLFRNGAAFNTLQGLCIVAGDYDCAQEWDNASSNLVIDNLLIGRLSNSTTATSQPAFGNMLMYTGAKSFKIRNNTVVNGANQGFRNAVDANFMTDGGEVKNNIFAYLGKGLENTGGVAGVNWDGIANNYNMFWQISGANVTPGVAGANDLTSDPLFTVTSVDFHLQAGSPALFSGENGQTRGARWLGREAGNNTNTLFLNHFDSATTKADYTKALAGPMNAYVGTRPYDHSTTYFGGGSLNVGAGLGLGGTDQTYPVFTSGQWLINPHEGTLDFWLYQSAFDAGWISHGPYIYQAQGTGTGQLIDVRWQRTPGYVLQPYCAFSSGSWAHSMDSSVYQPLIRIPGWSHYAQTWSSLKDRSDLYVNGVLVDSVFSGISSATYLIPDAQFQTQILHMFGMQGTAYQFSGGHIDEMRISDIDRYNGASFAPNTGIYTGFTTPVEDWSLFDKRQ